MAGRTDVTATVRTCFEALLCHALSIFTRHLETIGNPHMLPSEEAVLPPAAARHTLVRALTGGASSGRRMV
jgi:hypothetical protein